METNVDIWIFKAKQQFLSNLLKGPVQLSSGSSADQIGPTPYLSLYFIASNNALSSNMLSQKSPTKQQYNSSQRWEQAQIEGHWLVRFPKHFFWRHISMIGSKWQAVTGSLKLTSKECDVSFSSHSNDFCSHCVFDWCLPSKIIS